MQSIKFDPEAWVQAGPNNSVPCGKQLHVRLSGPGSLEVDTGKGYRLVGYGTEFKVTLPSGGRCRSPEQTISVFAGIDVTVESVGAPFTNFDKRPGDSSVELLVKRALKEKAVMEALKKAERRAADQSLNRKRVDDGLQDEIPEVLEDVVDESLESTEENPGNAPS